MNSKIGRIGRLRSAALTLSALTALAIYLVRVVLPAAHDHTNGFAAYYTAAHILAHSPHDMARVYDDAWFRAQIPRSGIYGIRDIFNIQPPTMALLMLPLADLSPETARLAWTLLSLAALSGGLALLVWRLGLPLRWMVGILPACLLYRPITENLQSGQAYLVLFFLLCLFFRCSGMREDEVSSDPPIAGSPSPGSTDQAIQMRPRTFAAQTSSRKSEAVAGAALGLMLVLKTAAVWYWPLLLLGGRRRTLGWASVTAAMVVLVTLPLIGPEAWRCYFSQLPRLAREPQRYVAAYQTTTSLFGHLLIYDARWNPSPVVDLPWCAQILTFAVLLISLALSHRWGRLDVGRSERRMLTPALFGALAVANAPISEGYHYTLILPSLAVACWWAWRERMPPKACAALGLAALLLGAPALYLSHRLEAGWLALFAYPRVYGAYLLWGWLGWALQRSEGHGRTQWP